jgi:hypothetical protein
MAYKDTYNLLKLERNRFNHFVVVGGWAAFGTPGSVTWPADWLQRMLFCGPLKCPGFVPWIHPESKVEMSIFAISRMGVSFSFNENGLKGSRTGLLRWQTALRTKKY